MLAERSNPTEQEVYAGRLAEETNISKTAIMTQLETAVKRAGSKHRWEKKQQALKSGEMNQINVPYSAGGSQALGIASAAAGGHTEGAALYRSGAGAADRRTVCAAAAEGAV